MILLQRELTVDYHFHSVRIESLSLFSLLNPIFFAICHELSDNLILKLPKGLRTLIFFNNMNRKSATGALA